MQGLREREIQLLGKMLTLTSTSSAASSVDFNDQWKVLIYDMDCRDIISPLMGVSALRQKGVTLHMLINTEREPVPDAPAVYFVRPTEANITRIAEDCAKQLYRTVYLNFVTRIDRDLMEKLAKDLVASGCVTMVSRIFDQYLDVIALEQNLFSLNIKNSFLQYNEASLMEADIKRFMGRVSTGLLSLVRVLGALPIIRSPAGGAAQMLAQELSGVLRENISAKGPAQSLFEDCLVNDRSRPLLLIFDRACDLFPVLQHNATYQTLISDAFDFKLNKVTIELSEKDKSSSSSAPPKKKTYDLNSASDSFLAAHASSSFQDTVTAHTAELAEVSQREAAMRARPSGGANDSANSSSIESKGRDLGSAIESLPELIARKANLEAHANILHSLLNKIGERTLHQYSQLSDAILLANGRPDRSAIIAMLGDGEKGYHQDKARLLALVAATNDASNNSKTMNDELDAAFVEGCKKMATPPSQEAMDRTLGAVKCIRQMQSLSAPLSSGGSSGNAQTAMLSNLFNSALNQVTSLFTKSTPYYITRCVDNLAEGRACPEADSFTYFDPRAARDSSQMPANAVGHKFTDVIVFVMGGGTYGEFYNLQELVKGSKTGGVTGSSAGSLRSIMYGCSDLINADDFLSQLEKLGAPQQQQGGAAVGANSSNAGK